MILGIIPARGGSKTIPGKNLVDLCGRPLLAFTCEAARAAKIALAGRDLGVEVPFMRPTQLAADSTPMIEVLRHAVVTLEETAGVHWDVIVLLQPTSPLRSAEDIDGVVTMLNETGADSVVTVVEVPHAYLPGSLMRLRDGRLTPYGKGPAATRRQDKPKLYARNGPAVLALRRETLLVQQQLYGEDTRPFIMDRAASIDIDAPHDLSLAALLLSQDAAEGS